MPHNVQNKYDMKTILTIWTKTLSQYIREDYGNKERKVNPRNAWNLGENVSKL